MPLIEFPLTKRRREQSVLVCLPRFTFALSTDIESLDILSGKFGKNSFQLFFLPSPDDLLFFIGLSKNLKTISTIEGIVGKRYANLYIIRTNKRINDLCVIDKKKKRQMIGKSKIKKW